MPDLVIPDIGRRLQEAWFLVPMGIVGFVSWSVWILRWIMSRCYRPVVNDFRTTTSVVVPVYREDADVLSRCLASWLRQKPDEIILVVDTGDTAVLERLAQEPHPSVQVIPFRHRGKRSALAVGIRAARHEIVLLVDSDTAWEPGLLANVQMPFADPRVGGVGTRQNVYARKSSLWRVMADWLVNTRYLDYVPAQSIMGGVACLSGRTAAYRREVILPLVPELEFEYFMGRECVSGDDGRLTWLVLSEGYRTVYQSTARAWSMFPESFKAFNKQRVRWGRNSYRCYLTAIRNGWLWQQPLITKLTVMQIMLTPLSMLAAVGTALWAGLHQQWDLFALAMVIMVAGRGIRSVSHLREHPGDLLQLPMATLMVVWTALPIKLWAALTMNRQGWLTRVHERVHAEAQTEASLGALAGEQVPRG
jgi:cellulose synthase/poly-beta-1,6-N-acetylglucosamine synthase-like glycosyltransferase